MSGFSKIASPGSIPTFQAGKGMISPESLFGSKDERAKYQRVLDGALGIAPNTEIKVKKVKVEIFDLSNKEDVAAYEKLWAELLEKSSRMEVIVDARKDLVHRADGTSYWMKYVEYVEFGGVEGSGEPDGKEK